MSMNFNQEDRSKPNQEEEEEYNPDDKIGFNAKLIIGMDNLSKLKRDSVDQPPIKFSIDQTNAPMAKIQKYITADLFEELENDSTNNDDDKDKKPQIPPEQLYMVQQQQLQNGIPPQIMNNINRNKFDMSQKNYMNHPSNHKDGFQKKKKPFEIREGDWTCFECHNLNFAFRVKCNRCGLSREESNKECENFKNNLMNNMTGKNANANNYLMK